MDIEEEIDRYRSPRPTPQFYPEDQTFSTKRAKLAQGILRTPLDCAPPRPPVKSAPPQSRIFPNRRTIGPQAVYVSKSFVLESPHYSPKVNAPFFEQCFEVIEKIGQGSFAEVFKVRCRSDNQLYAVKKAHEKFRSKADRKRKIEEVAKYETLTEHPNMVKFYKAWEEDQILYIQMELCETSLSQLACRTPYFPEAIIWEYLIDIIFAVKHLHDRDVVHMDIKPENIFITSDNCCKLGDFGLVLDLTKNKDYSESTEGDSKYLAPELMEGHFSKAADIFSLGMTIMELASDLDLPEGGEPWQKLRHGDLPVELMSSRSRSLTRIIFNMLEPDYNKRPTVNELLEMPSLRKYMKKRLRDYDLQSRKHSTRRNLPPLPNLAKHQSKADTSTFEENAGTDEEMPDDSLNYSALAVPFDDSRADDEVDGYCRTPSAPERRALTEPVLRYHSALSPVSSSPFCEVKKRSECAASPLDNGAVHQSFDSDKSDTPSFSDAPTTNKQPPTRDDENEARLRRIEPKNLMQMFNDVGEDDDGSPL